MANEDRIIELENELNLLKEQLYRLCGCLYPQALGKDDLEYITTENQKGGAKMRDINGVDIRKGKKSKWIPVSERLPNDRDWYLGVFREPDTGFIGIPYICDYVGKVTKGTTKDGWILRGLTDTDNSNEYYMDLECVAWQPLPEPYKNGHTL